MRKHFSENFQPTEDELAKVWEGAIFVFDTNVLLNLYRMSEETSSKIRDILRKLKGRLFLPHQVAVEFFRHREEEIAEQVNTFEKVRNHLLKIPDLFQQAFSRHPCIPISKIADALKKVAAEQVTAVTESQQQNQINFLTSVDPILPELDSIFLDCTEGPYDKADDDALNKQVDDRVQQNLPPCFVSTGGKALPPPDTNPHRGDGRVWFQIVKHAEKIKKPLIFVTGDGKQNWWRTAKLGQHERIVGPHFLLVRDVESVADGRFVMYTQEEFLKLAPKFLAVPDQSDGIAEVKKIQEGIEEDKSRGPRATQASSREAGKDDRPKRTGGIGDKDSVPRGAELLDLGDKLEKSGETEAKKVN